MKDVCMYVCMYVYTNELGTTIHIFSSVTYIHTYIHACIHTYIQVYTMLSDQWATQKMFCYWNTANTGPRHSCTWIWLLGRHWPDNNTQYIHTYTESNKQQAFKSVRTYVRRHVCIMEWVRINQGTVYMHCMYVCMYVCMYIYFISDDPSGYYMYVCMYVCMYTL